MEYKGSIEQIIKPHKNVDNINTNSFQELTESLRNEYGEKLCFRYFENTWRDTSFNQFADHVDKLARFFTSKKLENKNILLLSESRPEVIETYFAAFMSNSVIVPLDVKLSPREISLIINEVKPALVITTEMQHNSLQEAAKFCDKSLEVITINKFPQYYSYRDLPSFQGVTLPKENTHKTGMIIYTSGSTGQMKGVETKGSQLLFQAHSLLRVGFAQKEERNLSMLPMNHLFEVSGTISSICAGYPVCVAHSLEKEDLGLCFQKHRPTQIFSVPLFCKSIMNGIKLNISDSPLPKRVVFGILQLLSKVFTQKEIRKKLFSPIHEKFGNHLQRIIVGGAAADLTVINFFQSIGIDIYEGYGLTETAPVISVNRVSSSNAGSVGQLIPGVSAKVDEESGEILTKGPHVMQGYYKRSDETNKVLCPNGWFRTGDIGYFDDSGFLYITGRSKNLIVLENGKKVHPEEIEKAFDDIDYIKEISIFGDKVKNSSNSKNIVMVVHLDEGFTSKNGRQSLSLLLEDIQDRSNRLAQYKLPTKILISANELPKTTTMKVKHFAVSQALNSGNLNLLFENHR